MKLLSRLIVFPFFVFVNCFFWVGRAEDCGGNKVAYTTTVGQSGGGKFRTVQEAIDSIKNNNDRWAKIHINAGTYTEKVEIPDEKPCIILEGEGREVTTITYDDHKQTDTSATFSSLSDNVVVKGITFKNSFNLAAALDLNKRTKGSQVTQAVAARIYGQKSAFYDCGFLGFQDTLWDVEGRHYFKNCYIEGAIDFIFGSGQSYYEDCVMNATLKTTSAEVPLGYITAQGRSSQNDPSGFVFRGGSVVGSGEVILGRAYGPYSRVIFYGTYLDSVVTPQGWEAWRHTGGEANFTYAEVECRGPGAKNGKRVSWEKKLSSSQLHEFSISSFIDQDGWIAKLP